MSRLVLSGHATPIKKETKICIKELKLLPHLSGDVKEEVSGRKRHMVHGHPMRMVEHSPQTTVIETRSYPTFVEATKSYGKVWSCLLNNKIKY